MGFLDGLQGKMPTLLFVNNESNCDCEKTRDFNKNMLLMS